MSRRPIELTEEESSRLVATYIPDWLQSAPAAASADPDHVERILEALGCPAILHAKWPVNDASPEGLDPERLRQSHAKLLTEAEDIVRQRVGDEVYARWLAGGIRARRDEIQSLSAALAAGSICLDVPHPSVAGHRLLVEAVRYRAGAFVEISCSTALGLKREEWRGFRLTFAPEAELRALASMGLSPRHLGVLRMVHGLEADRFISLLDLLLPYRYGSKRDDEDPVFAGPLDQGEVVGELPGLPTGYSFWFER